MKRRLFADSTCTKRMKENGSCMSFVDVLELLFDRDQNKSKEKPAQSRYDDN